MKIKFFFILIWLLLSCKNTIQDIDQIYSESITQDYGLDIEINYYLKENLEFKLIAPEIRQLTEPAEINLFPKGIKVVVYNNHLDTVATITSDFAIQKKSEKLVEVKKNVKLINLKNEQLNTEHLFWNRENKTIYTDDFVTINTDKQIIMGYGFVTDQSFSTYSLSNITGTIYL